MGVFSPCVKGRGQMKNVGDEQNPVNKATSLKWGRRATAASRPAAGAAARRAVPVVEARL